MSRATDELDTFQGACAFLRHYIRGGRGYTTADVRAGIARLKALCAGMPAGAEAAAAAGKVIGEAEAALSASGPPDP